MQKVLKVLEKLIHLETLSYINHDNYNFENSIKLDLYDIQNTHYEIRLNELISFHRNGYSVGRYRRNSSNCFYIVNNKGKIHLTQTQLDDLLQKVFKAKLTKESILEIEKQVFEVI